MKLTNKEVFETVQSIDKLIKGKCKYITKTTGWEYDEVESTVRFIAIKFFKNYYNKSKMKPTNFFLTYCLPKANIELIRNSSVVCLPYHSIEKGEYNNIEIISLDKNINNSDNDADTILNLIPDTKEAFIDIYDNREAIEKMLSVLNKKERFIVSNLYKLNNNNLHYTEIAKKFNCGYENIYKIKRFAIKKIKNAIKNY